MTEEDKRLYRQLSGSDSMETVAGGNVSKNKTVGAQLDQIVGNPIFKAEISIVVSVRYYSQAVVGTPVAAVPAAGQQNPLPVYLFGAVDYMSNYARARQVVPGGGGWTYADAKFINVGSGEVDYNPLPHAAAGVDYASGTIFNNLGVNGDLLMIVPMAGFVAGAAATTHAAEILIHCNNVGYTSLLASLLSDTVVFNMIRYVVPAAAVAQFGQQITLLKQSIFGNTGNDSLDPNTFITPGTFQPQIADMPLTLTVDKNFGFATQMMYTAVVPITFTWTITVKGIKKNG
jgi:hypothetical protein